MQSWKTECQTAQIQMRRLIDPSHLDLRCLQKPGIIACGVKELKEYRKHYHATELDAVQKYMIEHMWSSNEN